MEWQVRKMKDCSEIFPGYAFDSASFTENETDVPLVKGENLHQGYIDWATSRRWPGHDWSKLAKFQLKANDIVLAMDRPWIEAGLKWSWMKPGYPKALLVQRVARIRANKDVDQAFLRYIIGSGMFEGYIKPIVTGVNVPHISGGQIGNFMFLLPPLPIQRKIAAILSTYDDLIENNNRRIAILEKMAEEIYREWFVRMRFPGHEKAKFHKGVPDGWNLLPFSKLVHKNPPCRIDPSDVNPYVGMEDLSTTSMMFFHKKYRQGNAGSKFHNGDVLFPRITPSVENGKRGYVTNLQEGQAGIGSTEFVVFREKTLSSESIYFITCLPEFRKHAEISMAGASGRQRVQENCFDFFLIKTPPDSLLKDFSAVVKPMFLEIKSLFLRATLLRNSRDLLLSRLMAGKLSVEDLDIHFPLSMGSSESVKERKTHA